MPPPRTSGHKRPSLGCGTPRPVTPVMRSPTSFVPRALDALHYLALRP
jgi:hypothetical protein